MSSKQSNQTFRSIVTTPAAALASEHIMRDLQALQTKSLRAQAIETHNYLADLQKQLETL